MDATIGPVGLPSLFDSTQSPASFFNDSNCSAATGLGFASGPAALGPAARARRRGNRVANWVGCLMTGSFGEESVRSVCAIGELPTLTSGTNIVPGNRHRLQKN